MSELRWLFGYGSLMYEPVAGPLPVRRLPARLPGWRRTFNKLSYARGCPPERSIAPDLAPSERFRDGGLNVSLALGVLAEPASEVIGLAFGYEAADWAAVRDGADRREGFDSELPPGASPYLRRALEVEPLEDAGGTLACTTYVTNPARRPPELFLPGGTDLRTRARALIAATPREPGPRALGLEYLEGCREALLRLGVIDRALEALAAAVHALPGPWLARVAPPRPTS